jgi:integrase/recombinase XerD
MNNSLPNALGRTVRGFFGQYLPELRGLSRHTVLSYRDTLSLLLRFVAKSRGIDPAALDMEMVSSEAVLDFLNHLESERHNKVSSRNVRLAAVHAFFRYVCIHCPEHLEQAQRILAIPFKRAATRSIHYFQHEEIRAVLESVDRHSPRGQRDYPLLALMFNTGARVQEIVDLNVCDLQLQAPAQVTLCGKGRKTRVCPLWPQTARVLDAFIRARGLDTRSHAALFCNQRNDQGR